MPNSPSSNRLTAKSWLVLGFFISYIAVLITALYFLVDKQHFSKQKNTTLIDRFLDFDIDEVGSVEKPDFSLISHIPDRKRAFFNYLLPYIRAQNKQEIVNLKLVQKLTDTYEVTGHLNRKQKKALAALTESYRIDTELTGEKIPVVLSQLKRRIGQIPPSMVLAQAANESAWGMSRFAVEGNNYFGQWCFVEGCGLVPEARPEGDNHEVARFDSPAQSIASYYRNINSHRAYRDLRKLRRTLRSENKPLTGLTLIEELHRYSEKGPDYVEHLAQLIRFNNLSQFDIPAEIPETVSHNDSVSTSSQL